eukprot:CAMPEP_0117612070 /NCGR_PEP_ID=MMETSP0784-20121206/82749_1 /TAXON_ID=39447 /ORGANISM="" /LENGTH=48 /DNA_ID= /DNA_START= /DNA_END= /DNA_ORIENTATION=
MTPSMRNARHLVLQKLPRVVPTPTPLDFDGSAKLNVRLPRVEHDLVHV